MPMLEDLLQKGSLQEEVLRQLADDNARLWDLVRHQHEVVVKKLDNLCLNTVPIKTQLAQDGANSPKSAERRRKSFPSLDLADPQTGQPITAAISLGTSESETGQPGQRLSKNSGTSQSFGYASTGQSKQTAAEIHWRHHIYERSGFLTDSHQENRITSVVQSFAFKAGITLLITLNSIYVGIEMQVAMLRAMDGKSTTIPEVEIGNHVFAFFFGVELLTRIAAYRVHFFLGEDWQWNIFDTMIVVSCALEYILSGFDGFSSLRALRVLRLAKTLRIIRVVTIFRNLQLILSSLMNSLLSLLWMLFLLLLALYLVTVVFMGAASDHVAGETDDSVSDPSSFVGGDGGFDDMSSAQMRDAFRRDFRTIPRGMLSMFFSITGGVDGYLIIRPLMNISWMYVVIFVVFQVFVLFGVFNVLNAVFVESVLTNRDKDLLIQNEHNKTKVFMRDLADLFYEGDTDGDNHFSYEELEQHCTNPRFCAYLNTHALDGGDAKVLFEMLDRDGSGRVDVEEFVLGALKLKGPARCLDMVRSQAMFERVFERLDTVDQKLSTIPGDNCVA
jgi:hypothetical protein